MTEQVVLPAHASLPLTRFIGRQRERTAVARLLGKTRLLTLTGAGGSGKTRLALALVERTAENYADGAAVIELAALTDPTRVLGAVAATLGVREQPGIPLPETLLAALRPRTTLLVLDNCEHLLEATAPLAVRLLAACPGLTVLATSREALGVAGEVTWRVPPLSLPDNTGDVTPADLLASEAAQLFADRAGARQPGFVVTRENAAAVATICRQLDGMPLALELAAARVGAIPLDAIAARLDDALGLLTAGNRAALPRQQTLRGTLAWSHALLNETEQIVLRRLSVFVGGCTLPAATAVCASNDIAERDVPEQLARLVEQSLLTLDGEGDDARYRALETVRQFAAERLDEAGETAATCERHAAYFLTVAIAGKEGLAGLDTGVWLTWLDAEFANLRAALAWSRTAHAVERGLRIAALLWRFWYLRSLFTEGVGWLSGFLDAPDASQPPQQARLDALFAAGRLSIFAGKYDAAQNLLEEMLALGRLHAQPLAIASALTLLGTIAFEKQAFREARALYIEAVGHARASGDGYALALAANSVAKPMILLGEIEQAAEIFAESLPLYHAIGDTADLSRVSLWLGIIAMEQGDRVRARALFIEGLEAHRRMYTFVGIAECLEGLAALAVREKSWGRALVLASAADTIRATIGSPCPPYWRDWLAPRLDTARLALGVSVSATAWAVGTAMTMDEACTQAMAEPLPVGARNDLRSSTVAGRRAAKQWYGGLTAREREIATLVAGNRSNREIAAALFVAEKTVETHIGHTLRKLSFTGRTQLAGWAIAVGLVATPDTSDTPLLTAPRDTGQRDGMV